MKKPKFSLTSVYIDLLVGVAALSIAASFLPITQGVVFGGGAFVCLLLLIVTFLFEKLYKAVAK